MSFFSVFFICSPSPQLLDSSFVLSSVTTHDGRTHLAPQTSHSFIALSLCSDCFIELLICSTSRASKFFLQRPLHSVRKASLVIAPHSLAISKTLVFLLCNIT